MNSMDAILMFLQPLLEGAAGKYGIVAQILMVIGALRVVFKPVMSLIQAVVKVTPSEQDDSLLNKILESKAYIAISYILDWSASIKLPQKPKG